MTESRCAEREVGGLRLAGWGDGEQSTETGGHSKVPGASIIVTLFTRQGQEKKGFEQISCLVLLITGAAAETSFARHLVTGFLSQRWLEL